MGGMRRVSGVSVAALAIVAAAGVAPALGTSALRSGHVVFPARAKASGLIAPGGPANSVTKSVGPFSVLGAHFRA
jgi:hypothetical protein